MQSSKAIVDRSTRTIPVRDQKSLRSQVQEVPAALLVISILDVNKSVEILTLKNQDAIAILSILAISTGDFVIIGDIDVLSLCI